MESPIKIIDNYLKNWQERNSLGSNYDINISSDFSFGDYSSNIAMVSSKGYKSPIELAEKIVDFLNESHEIKDTFKKINVAGPGFINFYLSDKYLFEILKNIDDKFGRSKAKRGKTVVEFGDPNPFKQIHIGHFRNFCIGESFSRLLESQGVDIIRVNYQGDVGMHVAKAIYAIKNKGLSVENLTAEDLAKAYAFGANEFEKSEDANREIQKLNKLVYEGSSEIKKLWEKGRKISLDDFEKLYKRIGIEYKEYFFESEAAKRGREIVLSNIENGIFEKDDGAIIYRGEKDGLHTRVFLTREDYATYEAKDLALAVMKDEKLHYDKSIILTGNEQAEYFQVMLSALRKVSPELSDKTTHLTFGHVRLREGKMSSRTGDVITADWLLDESIRKIKENFPEIDNDTAEKVGTGAIKYSMLKFGISSDIHFDFNESISLEGNSGPYLQYAFVRTKSILDKISNKDEFEKDNLEKEEEELLRLISYYPYFIEKSAREFAPNILCNYLFELSQKFNLFYQKHKILGSDKEILRIELVKATNQILKNGLNLLGIETVNKM